MRENRRSFLRNTGVATVSALSLAGLSNNTRAATRRLVTIEEPNGTYPPDPSHGYIDYVVKVNSTDVQWEQDSKESSYDNMTSSNGTTTVEGRVHAGKDYFSIPYDSDITYVSAAGYLEHAYSLDTDYNKLPYFDLDVQEGASNTGTHELTVSANRNGYHAEEMNYEPIKSFGDMNLDGSRADNEQAYTTGGEAYGAMETVNDKDALKMTDRFSSIDIVPKGGEVVIERS